MATKRTTASYAVQLLELANKEATFFTTAEGVCYARYLVKGHHRTASINSKAFCQWLAARYYARYKAAVSTANIKDAATILAGIADLDGPKATPSVRKACIDGNIHLDLGDSDWNYVVVTPEGWNVVESSSTVFRRPDGLLPMPCPERGGELSLLRQYLNLADEEDWRLLVGWLLAALGPHRPYPVLQLLGEQGSAKSTLARIVRRIVDPNKSALRTRPKTEQDLMIAANNGMLLAYDNLSSLPGSFSDALCRLSTGGGFSTRKHYTDDEEVLIEVMRPVILTGITELVTAPDLLDRTVTLRLPVIHGPRRRSEEELWQALERDLPVVLGALLDVMALGLQRLPSVRLENPPRLADFATWVTACEPALGWPDGSFVELYASRRSQANRAVVQGSVIGRYLRQFAEERGEWDGTADALLGLLRQLASADTSGSRVWPQTAKALMAALDRLAPCLRTDGVLVERLSRRNSQRLLRVRLLR